MNRKHYGCLVDGCDRQHEARGYCRTHYTRLYRHGAAADLATLVRKIPKPGERAHDRPGYHRDWTYNLAPGQYEAMYEAQDGRCAVCERRQEVLDVDHDHRCCPGDRSCGRCVRGLLCRNCNRAAGYLGESAENAVALGFYLGRDRSEVVAFVHVGR
jgi:hypothetical protein